MNNNGAKLTIGDEFSGEQSDPQTRKNTDIERISKTTFSCSFQHICFSNKAGKKSEGRVHSHMRMEKGRMVILDAQKRILISPNYRGGRRLGIRNRPKRLTNFRMTPYIINRRMGILKMNYSFLRAEK